MFYVKEVNVMKIESKYFLAQMPLGEIFTHLDSIEKNLDASRKVETVAGGVVKPKILLSNCFPKYLAISKNLIMDKTNDQIRKWQNPRDKAMRNFIRVVGDKSILELIRDDTLKVRDALILRVQAGKILPVSANKEIIQTKAIIESVSDNLNLNLDVKYLFRKLILVKGDEDRRRPFSTEYIVRTLLNDDNLKGLNSEAKAALYALAETGAGFSELTGLLHQDIILDHEVPHIRITTREKHKLKTKFRRREIPLVGYALEAFRAYPQGFKSYFGKPDSLSAAVNKYLRENKLIPSEKHSAYSLRHSLQDRLTHPKVPERVQADIMGHKFSRPYYGDGGTLTQKQIEMQKNSLKFSRELVKQIKIGRVISMPTIFGRT